MIDDSGLFHGTYDPVKAREYYLRTRKLKGRRPTTATRTVAGRGGRRSTKALSGRSGKPNRADTKSRRAELLAQKAALEKRLDRLREVLEQKVAAAKTRSGVKKPKKEDAKDTAPETKADTADRNKDQKDRTPLTAKQKTDKARKAKEEYEKEHPTSLSDDVAILREQVKDIQAKIQKTVADARERRNKAGKKGAELVRPNATTTTSGPRGR